MPVGCESVYFVRDDVSVEVLTRSLQSLLPTRYRAIVPRPFTILDTFDGRIRKTGARLTVRLIDGRLRLAWYPRYGGHVLEIDAAQAPCFAWDVPEGALRNELTTAIGARRLLPQVDASHSGALLDILDRRSKTVARVRIESGQARSPVSRRWHALPTMLTLSGLRGFDDEYARLKPVIESRPGLQVCPEDPVAVMLRHLGLPVRDEISCPRVQLTAAIPAEVGARQIYLALLEMMRTNEPGVRDNLDTEFLHDFRVTVRRTRSLLSQIQGVFAPEIIERFAREFSWLGKLTGAPRDLDVLILTLRERQVECPSVDMDLLVDFLARVQQRQRRELIEALDSDRYARLLAEWEAFLRQPVLCETSNKSRLREIVSLRAWRLSRRIARRAKVIDERTPAKRLHEVRIAAKKLRYLIDVTPGFYAAEDLDRILRPLKKVQRVLGDFNDAHVQERRLLGYRRALAAEGGPQGALLALGRLATESRRRRSELRGQVSKVLSRFGARKTRSACRRAFKDASA
jgi:CHAD domain-containing protein